MRAVAALAAVAASTPTFGATTHVASVPWNGYLTEIAVGDVTGDGKADIVGVRQDYTHGTLPLVILAGNGKGGFSDVTSSVFVGPVPGTQHARQIVLADFNGDHVDDIYVADHGYDAAPFAGWPDTLVLSQPGGKLVDASANLPRENGFTHSAAAADVNGDGANDIYVGNLGSATSEEPAVLANDGTGHFTRIAGALPDFMLGPYPSARFTREAFADVNGDGAPDLVLLSEGDANGTSWGSSRVLLNDGRGHFHDLPGAIPAKPFGGPSEGLAIATADLNGDGKVDVIAGYARLGGPGERFYVGRYLQILINNGDGTFRDETSTRLPQSASNTDEWPNAIRLADLNGDGKVDLGVSDSEENQAAVPSFYLNDGSGSFTPMTLAVSPHPLMDLADVNGDGRVDIVSATTAGQGGADDYAVNLQPAPTVSKPKAKPTQHKPAKKRHHR